MRYSKFEGSDEMFCPFCRIDLTSKSLSDEWVISHIMETHLEEATKLSIFELVELLWGPESKADPEKRRLN
jgi:hypothetical protein